MVDDSTVIGECCFFGGLECTKVFLFAFVINSDCDYCFELLSTNLLSSIPTGVSRRYCSFLATHYFLLQPRLREGGVVVLIV